MAALQEARVPDIGDFSDVPVIELLVAVGDRVKKDQGLITLESDKATMEVPAPFDGVVKEVKVKVGDSVGEGALVALIEASSETQTTSPASGGSRNATGVSEGGPTQAQSPDTDRTSPARGGSRNAAGVSEGGQPEKPATSPHPTPPAREESQNATGVSEGGGERASPPIPFNADTLMPGKVPYASPAMRAFARELGVDLQRVAGTGRKGRITREDVQGFVKQVITGGGAAAPATGGGMGLSLLPWPKVDFGKFGEIETTPLSRIKKISGANLARNWAMIPHVTQQDEADITEMEAFRKRLGEENKDLKVTPLVFLIKAVVAALKQFPTFNASLDESGENLVLKKYFHIGIAVDTPDGLVVPVIRDCERKGMLELAAEMAEISKKARDRKLGPADMSGGCFSISSLGGIGGTGFTPIVNAPEVAILGVSRSAMKPVWDGKAFQPRLMLPLSLSYDHRVVDGAAAARFTSYLAQVLGDLRRLLL
ncbi:MAG TPA: dihydrolipoyllysine-residue acetyltransferase [Xanthomonadaceae bacterium]|nr:dihydrolipoyllysine-residue acetyltransferase [Xanthomonadaceae bacterium]